MIYHYNKENELKSKLYAPMTEEEMLERLKKSREQGIFKDADRVISNMRSTRQPAYRASAFHH